VTFSQIVSTALLSALAVHEASGQTNPAPLRLVLACDEASIPTFRLTIQNVSAAPTAAIIGTVIANDRWYVLQHVSFTLSRRGDPDVSFEYSDPSMPAAIAGRLDPWVIQLPAGASYSVLAPVRDQSEPFSRPAQVRVTLTTQMFKDRTNHGPDTEPLSLLHHWVGTVKSDPVAFPLACRVQ